MSLVSSVRWAAVAQVSRIAAQLISVTVLSRVLPQQAYGMLAMALTIINLAVVLRDFGTSTVIIQRDVLPDGLKAAVHTVNVLIGFLVMGILLALALPTARVYGVAELAPIIAALALIFPIAGYGLLAQALVERESGFRLLARIEVLSILAGLVTSISLAMLGAGVWSMVAQMLVSTLVTNLQLQLAVKERSGFAWSLREIVPVLKFGGDVSLFRLLSYAEQNADSMIIGRALGPLALASYSMASKIALFPVQNLTWPISRALLPAFSRNQHSPAALAATYLRSVGVICIVAAPVMAGVFLLRQDLTLLLFGPRWDAVPGVLQWLAPVGFLHALTATTGVVFLALGRTRLMLKLGLLGCALQVGGYVIGVRWGIQGVAAGFFVANLLNFVPCLACVMRCLGITLQGASETIARPLAACLAMCLMLAWLGQLTQLAALPLVIAVALKTACAAGTYLFVLRVVLRQDLSSIVALVRPS